MDTISPKKVVTQLRRAPLRSIQEGFVPFTEKPSDKYKGMADTAAAQQNNSRINAFELFSHFTAEIIKKKVLFTR